MRESILLGAEADEFDQNYADLLTLKVVRMRPEKRGHFSGCHPCGWNRAFAHSGASACGPLREPIYCLGEQTAVPVVLNTSFNENGPIMHTPREAIDCFMRTKMDVLAISNYLVKK